MGPSDVPLDTVMLSQMFRSGKRAIRNYCRDKPGRSDPLFDQNALLAGLSDIIALLEAVRKLGSSSPAVQRPRFSLVER